MGKFSVALAGTPVYELRENFGRSRGNLPGVRSVRELVADCSIARQCGAGEISGQNKGGGSMRNYNERWLTRHLFNFVVRYLVWLDDRHFELMLQRVNFGRIWKSEKTKGAAA